MLIRREALDRVGGWSVEFTGISDYHLWLCLSVRSPLMKSCARTVGYRLQPDSMSFTIRATRFLELLAKKRRAAEDALRSRLQVRPGEEALLLRRLHLLEPAHHLAEAFLARDRGAFREAARELETAAAGERQPLIRSGFIDLLWYFVPATRFAEKARGANALLRSWRRWWPRRATRTRCVLRQLVWLSCLARAVGSWCDP